MEKLLSTKGAFFVWIIAALFYLYELVLRVAPSVMTNELMVSFDATSTMLGILVSFYYYAYTILQLPCGIILDRLGVKNLLAISALLCVIGSMLFGCANQIYVAQIGRFIVGSGSACAFISCLQIAAKMFDKKHFVVLAGATNMMGTVGGFLGGYPIAKCVNNIGWQNTTYILAGVGLLISVAIFVFIPNKIEQKHKVQNENSNISIVDSFFKLLANSQIVLSGMIASFMYLPVCAFAELWAVPFFMSKYQINNEKASIASALIFIGVAVGSVLIAIIARKIRSYMLAIKISTIAIIILFIPLAIMNFNISIAFVLVFLIGIFTGAQPICFTCAKNQSSPELSGTTLALTNGIVMLIGSIFQPVLGAVLDAFWTGKISESGIRVYDSICYRNAILIIPMFLVISYILSLFVKETIHKE